MLPLRKRIGTLLLSFVFMLAARHADAQHLYIRKIDRWIDWNLMFKEGTDSTQRQSVINNFTSQIAAVSKAPIVDMYGKKGKITAYLRKQAASNRDRIYITRIRYRPCNNGDTLFVNIIADAEIRAQDSTTSYSGSTPPKPPVKPTGSMLSYLEINQGFKVLRDSLLAVKGIATQLSFGANTNMENNAVIAVLDSGIDTMLYAEGFRSELLWHGPSGSKNMVEGGDENNYMDGFSARHGTAVAAIALNSYYRSSDTTSLPKLMVVKVLNDEGAGTVFDLCCGLHYATRNHATVINASLGYFQSDASVNENEVLEYYLAKCRADSIPVVAAAGNTGEIENRDLLCVPNTTGSNRMSATNMFLPASYAQDPVKFSVISVTGLGKPGIPCYYQNFSEQFVTMGVLNMGAETNCCSYKLPFFFRAVDGTSYAAPVVSGRLAYKIARLGHHSSLDQYLSEMNVQRAPNAAGMLPASHANQYITY